MAEKGGYKHFMLKEIYEQPRAVRDTTLGRVGQESGRIFLDEMDISAKQFKEFRQVRIVACGTSWHAALAGKFMIEKLARMPVEVDYGSEFRYRDPIISNDTLTVVISQSGETADTLAAQREAKQKGSKTLAICNVVGSMVTREASGTIITHAGPEIGVASSKAFTSQLTALFLLAMYLGQAKEKLDESTSRCLVQELLHIPGKLETVLSHDAMYEELARKLFRATDFLFLGRGVHFPIALEGALKLKEISYIHAEGYPAGEMKHGPNALIDEKLPVVVLAAHDPSSEESRILYEKTLSNIQEVKAREGIVIAIANEGDKAVGEVGRLRHRSAGVERSAAPHSRSRPAAIAGLSHRGAARLRRGPAQEPREKRHRGMKQSTPPGRSHQGQGTLRNQRSSGRLGPGNRLQDRPSHRLHPAHVGIPDDSGECRSRT